MKLVIKYCWIVLLWVNLLPAGSSAIGQTMIASRAPICSNYLHIKGESNINEFSFIYYSVPENIGSTGLSGDSIVISIPVREFEASNSMMYKDFLDLMKENEHPCIFVTIAKKQLESAIKNQAEPCPEISITIAGVTRSYSIDCKVEKCSGNYYLKGTKVVKLSDFRLKPPARLLGLVRVNNEIAVNFGFIITFTPDTKLSAKL